MFFAFSHSFARHNENFAAATVGERAWMVAGVFVLRSASSQEVLESNFIIFK